MRIYLALFSLVILRGPVAYAVGDGRGPPPLTPSELKERDSLIGQTKIALVLGGGGEPAGDRTLFDFSTESTLKNLNAGQYRTLASFDGGHSKIENILKNNLKTPASNFTTANALSKIRVVKSVLENNQLKPGAQLVVVINSHGGLKSNNELSHSVVTDEDLGTDRFTLDALRNIQELAKQKHIKLAIIDHSCYSGTTQSLADSNTCVISAASPSTVAYAGFAISFGEKMVPGQSLENAFLAARMDSQSPGLPEISTPANKAATDLIQRLRLDLESVAEDVRKTSSCEDLDSNLLKKNIFSILTTIQSQKPMSIAEMVTIKNDLIKQLQSYRETRKDAAELMEVGKKELVVAGITLNYLEFASLNSTLEQAKNSPKTLNKNLKSYYAELLAHETELKNKRKMLIESDPKFIDLVEKSIKGPQHLSALDVKLLNLADAISPVEQRIYNSEYQNALKKESKSVCSDFIL